MKNVSTPPVHPEDAALGRSLLRASIALNIAAAVLGFFPGLLPDAINPQIALPILLTMGFGSLISASRIRAGKWAPLARRARSR